MLTRGRRGQQIVEVVVGIIAIIPIFLFLFDIYFLFLVTNLNDGIARDAARAAASVFPEPLALTPGRALDGPNRTRAEQIVNLARRNMNPSQGKYIQDVRLADNPGGIIISNIPQSIELVGGSPTGSVTVRTTIRFNVPVTFGSFGQDIPLTAEATFPLTCSRQGNLSDFIR